MNLTKRIRTVLYGDQKFSAPELELLHTPAFQRLYDLHQLGLTDRVFIDASHSRLHHVIGVVEQATNLMQCLAANLRGKPESLLQYTAAPQTPRPTFSYFARLVTRRIPAARLMAFLHDLTHSPYGHTLEDEIRLVEETHDEPARQAAVFYRVVLQLIGWLERNSTPINTGNGGANEATREAIDHLAELLDDPELTEPQTTPVFLDAAAGIAANVINTANARSNLQPFCRFRKADLIDFLKSLSFAMRAMLFLEAAHKKPGKIQLKHIPEPKYTFEVLFEIIFQKLRITRDDSEVFVPNRDAFMLDVIGNTICADLLDYAKRDSINAGLKLDYDPNRVIENVTLISYIPTPQAPESEAERQHPFRQHSIRTAISLFGHKLRTDIPGELLNLLQVRYYVYERMLYHPTKCIAGAMLGASVQLIGWRSLPLHFRQVGDAVFLKEARDAARLVRWAISTLGPLDQAYSTQVRDSLKRLLPNYVSFGVVNAAHKLLDDRVVLVHDVLGQLEYLAQLRTHKSIARLLIEKLRARNYSPEAVFDSSIKEALLQEIPAESPDSPSARALLGRITPGTARIKEEIEAGLVLLSRIGSRQFHKSVFRLLPRIAAENGEIIEAEAIANKFLLSTVRFIAEREIETRARLPVGSIVIHCPSADGPTKIANILITPGRDCNGQPNAVALFNIGRLHDPIFVKHEQAIKALQDMYRSMWRLVVSVSPRYTVHWEAIAMDAGNVIYELLAGGDDAGGPANNDTYMEAEIRSSLSGGAPVNNGNVQIKTADGAELEMSSGRFELLQRIAGVLEQNDEFKSIIPVDHSEPVTAEAIENTVHRLRSHLTADRSKRNRGVQSRLAATTADLFVPEAGAPSGNNDSAQAESIEDALDEVLQIYRPFMAEHDCQAVDAFRTSFIRAANARGQAKPEILRKLRDYRIDLMQGERIEYNRAEAEVIIQKLNRILGIGR